MRGITLTEADREDWMALWLEAFPEDIWFMETETRELFDIDRREDLEPQADGRMDDTNCMACRDAAKIEPAERRGGCAYGKAEK